MKTRLRVVALPFLVGLLAAACAADPTPTPEPTATLPFVATPTSTPTPTPAPTPLPLTPSSTPTPIPAPPTPIPTPTPPPVVPPAPTPTPEAIAELAPATPTPALSPIPTPTPANPSTGRTSKTVWPGIGHWGPAGQRLLDAVNDGEGLHGLRSPEELSARVFPQEFLDLRDRTRRRGFAVLPDHDAEVFRRGSH